MAQVCIARDRRTRIVNVESIPDALALRACAERYPLDDAKRLLPLLAIRLLQMWEMEQRTRDYDIVLGDRCLESIFANNVDGRIPGDVLDWVAAQVTFEPAITLFLDVPLEEALRRNPMSKTLQNPSHASQIFNNYQSLAAKLRWTRIDATQPVEAVTRDCLQALGL